MAKKYNCTKCKYSYDNEPICGRIRSKIIKTLENTYCEDFEQKLPTKQEIKHIHISVYDDDTFEVETNMQVASDILGMLEYAKINIFTHVSKNNRLEKIVK